MQFNIFSGNQFISIVIRVQHTHTRVLYLNVSLKLSDEYVYNRCSHEHSFIKERHISFHNTRHHVPHPE